jgi:hypothetical protein
MKFRSAIISLALLTAGFTGTAVAVDSGAAFAKHSCTKTSTHHCIKGGQFCPKAKYKKSGWDAKGRRYVCKGDHDHPHWKKP